MKVIHCVLDVSRQQSKARIDGCIRRIAHPVVCPESCFEDYSLNNG